MNNTETIITQRGFCYTCYRPSSSCMCRFIEKIETKTKFVILMHPKEFRKTKNGTGQFTKNILCNSELFKGIDFSNHNKVNQILDNKNNDCYLLYPGENSLNLSQETISSKGNLVIFIIDSTWPCSKKIIKNSKNLQKLKMISFDPNKTSAFKIKKQPNEYCLSTIESTQYLIELLNKQKIENLKIQDLKKMTKPFEKMVEYQLMCAEKRKDPRYKNY